MGHCVFDSREDALHAQVTLTRVSDVAVRLGQQAFTLMRKVGLTLWNRVPFLPSDDSI